MARDRHQVDAPFKAPARLALAKLRQGWRAAAGGRGPRCRRLEREKAAMLCLEVVHGAHAEEGSAEERGRGEATCRSCEIDAVNPPAARASVFAARRNPRRNSMSLDNAAPVEVHAVQSEVGPPPSARASTTNIAASTRRPRAEVFELIRCIQDARAPARVEQLNVAQRRLITARRRGTVLHADDPALLDGDADRAVHPRQRCE